MKNQPVSNFSFALQKRRDKIISEFLQFYVAMVPSEGRDQRLIGSTSTIDFHSNNIGEKLGVRNKKNQSENPIILTAAISGLAPYLTHNNLILSFSRRVVSYAVTILGEAPRANFLPNLSSLRRFLKFDKGLWK